MNRYMLRAHVLGPEHAELPDRAEIAEVKLTKEFAHLILNRMNMAQKVSERDAALHGDGKFNVIEFRDSSAKWFSIDYDYPGGDVPPNMYLSDESMPDFDRPYEGDGTLVMCVMEESVFWTLYDGHNAQTDSISRQQIVSFLDGVPNAPAPAAFPQDWP